MNMKSLLLTSAIAATGLLFATSASAADGTITVTGQILAQTCQVNGNPYGTPASVSVALPNVLATTLATAGNTAGDTPFQINITGCASGLTSVRTDFSGSDINSNGRLSNSSTAASVASNVDVQLLNSSGAPMALNQAPGSQNSQVVNLSSSGAATMNYTARYYATGAATAGAVKATVDFTMTYQ